MSATDLAAVIVLSTFYVATVISVLLFCRRMNRTLDRMQDRMDRLDDAIDSLETDVEEVKRRRRTGPPTFPKSA